MTDTSESSSSLIGSSSFDSISNSTIEVGRLTNITRAGGNITITNYHYYTQDSTSSSQATSPTLEPDLPSPYQGIYHFGPNDAPIFFGREDFTARLVELVGKQNFIALLGASGSGKSSVVFAGLVPALAETEGWKFTHFRPGHRLGPPLHAPPR